MKTRTKIIIAIALAAGAVLAARASYVHEHRVAKPTPAVQTNPVAKPTPMAPAAALNPMAIAAIQARSYPGSAIAVSQDLGEQGGYRSRVVSYQSDGLKINALLAIPDGTPPSGGWPAIVFNHGYIIPSQYSTINSYKTWVAALAKAGFVVVKPDYRGNAQSQGQPEGGHFSPVYAYDVLNAVASIKQFPGVNPSRIGVFGHSMGGHEALRAIVATRDIKATVFAAGVVGSFYDIFYNWPNSPAPGDQPLALVQGKRQALVDKYGDPKANPDFWNSTSAINYVSVVAGPVEVNQDVSDAVVPKTFADHLVAALQAAHKPVEYYTYPGNDHNFTSSFNLLMQRSIDFYRANL